MIGRCPLAVTRPAGIPASSHIGAGSPSLKAFGLLDLVKAGPELTLLRQPKSTPGGERAGAAGEARTALAESSVVAGGAGEVAVAEPPSSA